MRAFKWSVMKEEQCYFCSTLEQAMTVAGVPISSLKTGKMNIDNSITIIFDDGNDVDAYRLTEIIEVFEKTRIHKAVVNYNNSEESEIMHFFRLIMAAGSEGWGKDFEIPA